jgi:glycosyltransferase involved in cell wall biosynthesis
MRVLFYIDKLGSGGKERQLVELLRGLKKRADISPSLVCMSGDIHYTEVHDLVDYVHVLERRSRRDPSILFRLNALCSVIQPQIIQAWDSMTAVYALPICKVRGIKFVNCMIQDAPERIEIFSRAGVRSRLTFPFSDAIVANSYAGLEVYRAPADRSKVIHNGFDFSRITKLEDPAEIRHRFDITLRHAVGMVARMEPIKDYGTYIKAASIVREKRSDVMFLAIGGGTQMEELKNAIPEKHRPWLRFLGKQSDVESIVQVLDIGVLCTYTEGISNSILEYMALSKPVIATRCRGNMELVEDGKTGFLVPLRDPEAVSQKILDSLDHPEAMRSMGEQGRSRIESEFSITKMVDSFINVYKSLVR